MWHNGNPNIKHQSTCDYSLTPLNWEEPPIVVVKGYFTPQQVQDSLRVINANRIHAICNLGYSATGSGVYLPEFRRSADLNASFFPASTWDRIEGDMLRYAIDKYGARYTAGQKALQGGHSFATIYQRRSGVLQLHADAGVLRGGVWQASVTTRYEMTGLIYLTSAGIDFTGGTLQFPYILDPTGVPYQYQPVAGDAVFFPSNPLFAHSVSASEGSRILLGAWRFWRPYVYKG